MTLSNHAEALVISALSTAKATALNASIDIQELDQERSKRTGAIVMATAPPLTEVQNVLSGGALGKKGLGFKFKMNRQELF